MIGEYRATQADRDARRHFTPEKTPIMDARSVITEWLAPVPDPFADLELRSAHSASALSQAADTGFIETG